MKYVAILKDSFREAIDTKVFYVMVGLSSLLMLFVASISFRPLTMEEELQQGLGQLNWILSFDGQNRGQKGSLHFAISDFQQLNEAAEPWLGDYRFTFHMRVPEELEGSKAAAGQIRNLVRAFRGVGGISAGPVKQLLQARFPWFNDLTVREVKSSTADEETYAVTARGTKITHRFNWPHQPRLFFGLVPLSFWDQSLGHTVHFVEDTLVNGVGAWAAILVGIVVTAFFIPNMLRKGTVDLLLAKPIHRTTLLLFKYLGGLTFVFLNSAVVVLGLWVVLGIRSGIWAPGFLASIAVLTFFFAILYAVSALFGVWTRSPIVAILMTCVVWFGLWLVGFLHSSLETLRQREVQMQETAQEDASNNQGLRLQLPPWVYATVNAVHYVLPRAKDLDHLTTRLLSQELLTEDEIRQLNLDRTASFRWSESLTVSGVFITLMLGLTCLRFATKDY